MPGDISSSVKFLYVTLIPITSSMFFSVINPSLKIIGSSFLQSTTEDSIPISHPSKFKISALVKHLVNLLEKKDFFTPKEKKQSMLLNINNLIYRFEPNDKELRILASIISSLSKNNS